nr:immunoglobulin light chain junction region [Macaca mulatta]
DYYCQVWDTDSHYIF